MKKILYILMFITFIITASGCSINKNTTQNETQILQNNSNIKGGEQISSTKNDKEKIHVIMYFPDGNLKFLVPEERYIDLNKSLERTVVEEIIKGPVSRDKLSVVPKGTKINSITRKEDTIIVDFSKDFKGILNNDKLVETMAAYSIVNSLTQIPGIKKVIFKVDGKDFQTNENHIAFNQPFKRNRSLFNRNRSAMPNEILKQQIGFESQGKWLSSYMLSSDDENNTLRRYYNDYVKEMEEIRALGFMDQGVSIGNYTLDTTRTKAKVNVKFYTTDESGNKQENSSMDIDLIKIEGAWLVDWTLPE
jgi:spore germination protein GerM